MYAFKKQNLNYKASLGKHNPSIIHCIIFGSTIVNHTLTNLRFSGQTGGWKPRASQCNFKGLQTLQALLLLLAPHTHKEKMKWKISYTDATMWTTRWPVLQPVPLLIFSVSGSDHTHTAGICHRSEVWCHSDPTLVHQMKLMFYIYITIDIGLNYQYHTSFLSVFVGVSKEVKHFFTNLHLHLLPLCPFSCRLCCLPFLSHLRLWLSLIRWLWKGCAATCHLCIFQRHPHSLFGSFAPPPGFPVTDGSAGCGFLEHTCVRLAVGVLCASRCFQMVNHFFVLLRNSPVHLHMFLTPHGHKLVVAPVTVKAVMLIPVTWHGQQVRELDSFLWWITSIWASCRRQLTFAWLRTGCGVLFFGSCADISLPTVIPEVLSALFKSTCLLSSCSSGVSTTVVFPSSMASEVVICEDVSRSFPMTSSSSTDNSSVTEVMVAVLVVSSSIASHSLVSWTETSKSSSINPEPLLLLKVLFRIHHTSALLLCFGYWDKHDSLSVCFSHCVDY